MSFLRNLSINQRIFICMISLILIALSTMALITFVQFSNTIKKYNEEGLIRKEQTVLETIDYFISENNITQVNLLESLQKEIYKISDINNINILIYDLKGKLLLSTSKASKKMQLLSSIYNKLTINNSRIEILEKDELEVNNTIIYSYHLLYDTHNIPIGIVSIPYNNNTTFLVDTFQSLLKSIGIILFVLLIGSVIMAWYLSKSITLKLTTISNKLKDTQVFTFTKPISYNNNDELKPLVDSYNFMLQKLKEQTEILTKQEREDAWREMAKQVAHEIKNPLTPMKLMIQNFHLRFNPKEPQANEKVEQLSSALLQQIDTITEITDAFSDFAKMPNANDNEIDVVEVTTNTIDLFSSYDIEFKTNKNDIIRVMDNIYLSRILTNLIKNAIQAGFGNKKPKIIVTLFEDEKRLLIAVSDNGLGIPATIKDFIFQPKFTTKNSGIGLGLAMVKKIVDDYKGKIWFETQKNIGTTFFIELPNE